MDSTDTLVVGPRAGRGGVQHLARPGPALQVLRVHGYHCVMDTMRCSGCTKPHHWTTSRRPRYFHGYLVNGLF